MINSVKPGRMVLLNKARLMLGFIALTILQISCSDQKLKQLEWNGFTMGTTYTVKSIVIPGQDHPDPSLIQNKIDSLLQETNGQMSTYISDSEISEFNNAPAYRPVPVSKEFHEVMLLSKRVHELTSGAFDVTIKPLADIWGFGVHHPGMESWNAPDEKTIAEALLSTGMDKIKIGDNSLQKFQDDIEIDLNAVAKGYGVDLVAGLVATWFDNYMVEIGGEIRCSGFNRDGKAWMIGIESPELGKDGKNVQLTAPLKDQSMATSGDYRRFFIYEGNAYSHIIDPRTGYPTISNIASATVIAPTCALADALATAFMILSPEHGLELASSMKGVEVLLMIRESGCIKMRKSTGFPADE